MAGVGKCDKVPDGTGSCEIDFNVGGYGVKLDEVGEVM